MGYPTFHRALLCLCPKELGEQCYEVRIILIRPAPLAKPGLEF